MVSIVERANDRLAALQQMMEGQQSGMWTALPGRITSVDLGKGTVQVQPLVRSNVTLPDGTTRQQSLPVLADVPIVFPGGGGTTLTFPVRAGDECLVVFSSRPIDGWWQSGAAGAPIMPRMHSLSDGFAFVGVRNQGRALPAVSSSEVSLRSDDGGTRMSINPTTQQVNVLAPAQVNVTAPAVNVAGALSCTGVGGGAGTVTINGNVTINGELTVNGIVFSTHKHTGVQAGPSSTGGPTN